ncbi:MAG: DNA-3-methyladenine glycosylase [Pyrinomonadaceae bacterium]
MRRLSSKLFRSEDTPAIARSLLGKLLVVPGPAGERVSGMIVETEAYIGVKDRAAHSYGGRRTARNEITYAVGGHVYVFFVYGMYHQLNIVTGPPNHPHVVLVRGVEPVEGIDLIRERRATVADKNLTSGPGKLCVAFGIDRSFNGKKLSGKRIWIEDYRDISAADIAIGPRIGIDYAGEDAGRPWRFWIRGNSFVSRPRIESRPAKDENISL